MHEGIPLCLRETRKNESYTTESSTDSMAVLGYIFMKERTDLFLI